MTARGQRAREPRSRRTIPRRGHATSTKTPVMTRRVDAHEVSKPSVSVARWSAERIGPTIIGAPHRGQRPRGAGRRLGGRRRGRVVEVAAVDGGGEHGPRERHAGGATGVREKA